MRVVFMGTPEFAVPTLEGIHKSEHQVVGVVTVADKPAGRGKKLKASPVKLAAEKLGIPLLQPTNLKSEDFLKALRELNADVFVVVAFRMLPESVWALPDKGCFNLHASLLPKYRGAAPINWALINGDEQTGLTTFFIDKKIDTGSIIYQEKLDIGKNEILGSLYERMMTKGVGLVLKTLDKIETGDLHLLKQDDSKASEAPKLNAHNCQINWNKKANEVYNLIRGLNPFPAAYSFLSNGSILLNCKFYDCSFDLEPHALEPGDLYYDKKTLKIACSQGFIHVGELKVEGKKKMPVQSLLNGWQPEPNAKFVHKPS